MGEKKKEEREGEVREKQEGGSYNAGKNTKDLSFSFFPSFLPFFFSFLSFFKKTFLHLPLCLEMLVALHLCCVKKHNKIIP